jgi:hypothetical protein
VSDFEDEALLQKLASTAQMSVDEFKSTFGSVIASDGTARRVAA